MPLGVDFGTTHTIVAYADRGNYPVVSFIDDHGDSRDYFPSAVALTADGPVFGFDAISAGRAGAPFARSFKRALADPGVRPDSTLTLGGEQLPLIDLLTRFFEALQAALRSSSSVPAGLLEDRIPVTVSVPAHAHGTQRFVTLEAYRAAGFEVAAMINEPSAAGFEFTHRQRNAVTSRRNRVVVYDLGGGTFDASLVQVEGTRHEVLGSLGVNLLGGDDFDQVLVARAMALAGTNRADLGPIGMAVLADECRDAKERLSPQSKRISLEVAGEPVTVLVEDFYDDASALVETSLAAMDPLVSSLGEEDSELSSVAGIYLVGGATGLPLVPRMLRQRFGRRVHRSPYPAASTAIGLAIAADKDAGYSLTDRLSRGFGVFRERDGGQAVSFDPILSADEEVGPDQTIVVTRWYQAAHNVGYFRFVEYTSVDEHGEPRGDLAPFAEVTFPFDAALQDGQDLSAVAVERRDHGPTIEEAYTIDPHGIIAVTITDHDTGYRQTYSLTSARSD